MANNSKIKSFSQYTKKNKKKDNDQEEENWQDNIDSKEDHDEYGDDTFSYDMTRINPQDVEKINPKDYAITQVVDVFKAESGKIEALGIDPEDSATVIQESSYLINAGALDVKIGDTLYITAIIQSYNDPNPHNAMGVLKVRIQDMYKGLHMLNTLDVKNPPSR